MSIILVSLNLFHSGTLFRKKSGTSPSFQEAKMAITATMSKGHRIESFKRKRPQNAKKHISAPK